MGGNAFPNLNVTRVARQDIAETLHHVVETLNLPGLSHEYVIANLLGSAGKQDTSGDLDIALNKRPARFVGEPDLPVFSLRDVAARCREVLPQGQVNTRTIGADMITTAWNIKGDSALPMVQVDFLSGDPRWLKFAHWSPGLDASPHKGVAISTLWGVMAKMIKDFEKFSDGSFNLGKVEHDPATHRTRVALVGLSYDLEKGLNRRWQVQLRPGQGVATVEPEVFETKVPECPRLARTGYITDPDVALTILYGQPTVEAQVRTFEQAVARLRECRPLQFEEARLRFLESFARSSGANGHSVEDMARDPVWL